MNEQAAKIMEERFGRDCVIALATSCGEEPFVRFVNAYFERESFFVITQTLEQNGAATRKSLCSNSGRMVHGARTGI